MAWQFISKEQQKKTPIQWGQFIPKWTVNVPIREVTPNLWPITPIAVGAWALAWSYVAGKALEWIGKKLYSVNLPPTIDEAKALQSYKAWVTNVKPRLATDVLLDTPIIQKTPISQVMRAPTSPLWWIGTRSMIWTQAESTANKIFTKKINPIYKQLDKYWIKIDVPQLVDKVKVKMMNTKKYAKSQIDDILSNIDELTQGIQTSLSVKDLDLEKQALANKIPQKYQTMPKLPSEAKVAQKELANEFRKAVHATIKKMSWTDSAKLYQDYWALKWISEIWPKALTQAGRKWGSWTFMSWIADELATPVTTTAWKLTYKVWKWLQYLPKQIVEAIKKTPNRIMSLKDIAKVAIKEMPVWILAESFGDNISDVASGKKQKEEYTKALNKLRNNEKLWIMEAFTKSMIKWLSKEDAILLLEKLSK